MMNYRALFLLIVAVSLGSCPIQGQPSKKQLREQDYNRWGMITPKGISPDGKWVCWSARYDTGQDTLHVARADGRRKYALAFARDGMFFGRDGLYCRFPGRGGQIINLSSGARFDTGSNGKALVYGQMIIAADSTNEKVTLWNAAGKIADEMPGVRQFFTSPSGALLLCLGNQQGHGTISISRADGRGIKPIQVNGEADTMIISNPAWADNQQAVAFYLKTARDTTLCCLDILRGTIRYLGRERLGARTSLATDLSLGITAQGEVALYVRDAIAPVAEAPLVEVWHTQDKIIYPIQAETRNWKYTPKTALWKPDGNTLLHIADTLLPKAAVGADGRHALLWNPHRYEPQYRWIPDIDLYALNLQTGVKKCILSGQGGSTGAWQLSPDGRYVTYFSQGSWFNYDLLKETHILLSGAMLPNKEALQKEMENHPAAPPLWTADGSAVLLSDGFDLWRVSADGARSVRMTLGREKGIMYRVPKQQAVKDAKAFGDTSGCAIADISRGLILEAATRDHSKSGYFHLHADGRLKEIVFAQERNYGLTQAGTTLSWLSERFDSPTAVRSSMIAAAPKAITLSCPSVDGFHWGSVKRITYGVGKDTMAGLLYYPAGYQKGKAYPMMVHIYEKQSHRLHHFIRPSLLGGDGFNLTNFTSKGYFVLLPDIAYQSGAPGESALHCTEAAVIASFGYESGIDRQRIGLIGYSFGGYEAAFIATKSRMFIAIAAGAGITDFAGDYFSQAGHYNIPQYHRYETFQMRMGKPFHEDIKGYIANSPLYQAAGVTAPLMLYTGGKDIHIPHQQSRELYFALRRLGKPGYLVVYPEEEHGFISHDAMADLSAKVDAFFAHYLKGIQPELWMQTD